MQASCWFDKQNGFLCRLISEFKSVFTKRTDGAPHGHTPAKRWKHKKHTMPKNDSLQALIGGHGQRMEHPQATASATKEHCAVAEGT